MAIDSQYLSGYSISSHSTQTAVEDYDLFAVSTKDVYLSSTYESRRIDVSSLVECIAQHIERTMHIGSMAYKDREEYSEKDHSHDAWYNRLSIDVLYNPSKDGIVNSQDLASSVNSVKTSALSIGNMFFDGILSTICVPLSCVLGGGVVPWQAIEPAFGEIKFVAQSEIIRDIDYTSDAFDGWLWLDSSFEYDITAFRLSDSINTHPDFVKSIENAKFRVKDLSSFVTIDNGNSRFTYNESYTIVKSHSHPVAVDINGNVSARAKITIGHAAGPGGYFHDGNGAGPTPTVIKEKAKSVYGDTTTIGYTKGDDITSLTCSNEKTWNQIYDDFGYYVLTPNMEFDTSCTFALASNVSTGYCNMIPSYPAHNIMPAMVYVGRKKGF